MIKRKLEKEVEILIEESQKELKLPIKLEYYLLESEIEENQDLRGAKVFGIEVIKKIDGISDEVISYRDVSCNIECTQSILKKLAQNFVTPVSVPYIIEDQLAM